MKIICILAIENSFLYVTCKLMTYFIYMLKALFTVWNQDVLGCKWSGRLQGEIQGGTREGGFRYEIDRY